MNVGWILDESHEPPELGKQQASRADRTPSAAYKNVR